MNINNQALSALPELPKLRKKKEADATPKVMKWFMENYPKSYAVEVKYKKGKIQAHQPVALKKVSDNEFDYKLPDMGRRNPFDFFGLKNADAFIVYVDGKKCTAYTHDLTFCFEFSI